MASHLNQPHFQDENKAREHLEALRWPNGPICPHCGVVGEHYALTAKTKNGARPGLYKCKDCREQFTVTVGTVLERSKIKLNIWLQATHLICSSKKGISSHQLHRLLGVSYKTAWFMSHRIREAMTGNKGRLLGSAGGIVESDETFYGETKQSKARNRKTSVRDKMKIVALVERGGELRAFHVPRVNAKNVAPVLRAQVSKQARLMTDESRIYINVGKEFAEHQTVNHSAKEYARGDAHVNNLESFFNILKRGLAGTFHHVSEEHLIRYVNEFGFRYNNRTALGVSDAQRTSNALKAISGKRLMYNQPN